MTPSVTKLLPPLSTFSLEGNLIRATPAVSLFFYLNLEFQLFVKIENSIIV
jgi:hypothetical protein